METSEQEKWEWTPKRVQNILITVGSVLCGLAAILFSAFAWGEMSLAQRITALAVVTAATGIGGFAAYRNRMTATGEALTALSLLFAVIDAAGAYHLNLGGLQELPVWQYSAGVLASLAAIAGAYRVFVPFKTTEWFTLIAGQLPLPIILAMSSSSPLLIATGIAVQGLVLAAVGGRLNQPAQAYVANFGSFFLASIGAIYSLGVAVNLDEFTLIERTVPLVVLAAAAIALPAVIRKGQVLQAAPVAAGLLVLDAVIAVFDVVPQDFMSLSIALVGLATIAAAVPLKGSRQTVSNIGLIAVAAGSINALSDFARTVTHYATPFVEQWDATGVAVSGYFNSTTGVGSILTAFVVTASTMLVALNTKHVGVRVTAVIASATGVSMIPAVMSFGYTISVIWLTTTGTGVALAGYYVRKNESVVIATVIAGIAVLGEGTLLATAEYGAFTYATGTVGIIAMALAVLDRKISLPMSVVAAFALPLSSTTACIALGGSFVTSAIVLTATSLTLAVVFRYANLSSYAILAVCANAAVGILLSTESLEAVSVNLLYVSAASAVIALRVADRQLAWLAATTMMLFTWLRCGIADIATIEAYSIPLATLVLAAGHILGRNRDMSSWIRYGIGLSIAFAPTVAELTSDDGITRHIAVALAALLVVLLGAARRLQAPIAIGTGVLLFEAFAQFAPYATAMPRWIGVGTIGVIILALGATWESRYRDLQALRTRYESMK